MDVAKEDQNKNLTICIDVYMLRHQKFLVKLQTTWRQAKVVVEWEGKTKVLFGEWQDKEEG